MRVRRDQLVLGAVATALLVAIVVFAASTGSVDRPPAVPTPTATPQSERDLFGGSLEPRVRYRTRSFAPHLSFVVGDTEWLVEDASQPDHLVVERRIRTNRPGSELPSRSAVVFSRLAQVADTRSEYLLYVDDLYAAFKANPDLELGRRERVTVAGLDGVRFDETVRFAHPRPARAAPACARLLRVCTLIAPNRYYENGTRMHTYLLRMQSGVPLVIDIVGRTPRDLAKIEAPAAELLRTLHVSAR